MAEAMVKGLGLTDVVAGLEQLLEEGRLSRDRLEAELEAADLAILDAKVEPNLWYPVAAMGRMLRIILDVEADGRPERLQEISRVSTSHYLERPSFQGLVGEARRRGGRAGSLLLELPRSVFGFGRWSYEEGPAGERPRVIFEDCTALPEIVPYTTAGVMEGVTAAVTGRAVRVRVEWQRRDRVVFHFLPA